MFDISTPFSTFGGDKINGADLAIMQREMDIECAARYLTDLYFDDVDITNEREFKEVLTRYGLIDATTIERRDIIKQTQALIAKRQFD